MEPIRGCRETSRISNPVRCYVAVGTKASADFLVDIPFASNVGVRTETIHLWWSRPYYGDFRAGSEHTRQNVNLPFQTFPTSVGVGNMGSQENLIAALFTDGIIGESSLLVRRSSPCSCEVGATICG